MPFADFNAQFHPHSWLQLLNNWREEAFQFLSRDAPKIFGILVLAFIFTHFLRVVRNHLVSLSKRDTLQTAMRATQLRTLSSVVYSVGLALVFFIAGMQVLQVLNINIAPLLASAGIAGLAVGFGAQTLVRDVLNGFFILLENQFDIGDVIKVGAVQGTVEKLTLRRTLLRDADGTLHNVPNSQITIVSNMTRDWTQLAMHISVSYNESSDRVIELLKEVAAEVQHDPAYAQQIVGDPVVPGIEKVSAQEVDYLLLVKTRPGQQYEVSRELRRKIKECFEKNGIQPGGQQRFYVMGDPVSPAKT